MRQGNLWQSKLLNCNAVLIPRTRSLALIRRSVCLARGCVQYSAIGKLNFME